MHQNIPELLVFFVWYFPTIRCYFSDYRSYYTNITAVDFLDLTLNLKTGSYQPFRKRNNEPIHIYINSNHPPQILKQLPKSISKRLSKNSSSKEVFDKSKVLYEKSLENKGFYENLIYHQDNGNKNQHQKIKKRQLKITALNFLNACGNWKMEK